MLQIKLVSSFSTLLTGKRHKTRFMRGENWYTKWLDAVKQQPLPGQILAQLYLEFNRGGDTFTGWINAWNPLWTGVTGFN